LGFFFFFFFFFFVFLSVEEWGGVEQERWR